MPRAKVLCEITAASTSMLSIDQTTNSRTMTPTNLRRVAAAIAAVATVACVLAFFGSVDHAPTAFPQFVRTGMSAVSIAPTGESTLSWIPADSGITCGAWPAADFESKLEAMGVATEGMGWQCTDYSTQDKLNKRNFDKELNAETCKAWCTEQHNASDVVTGKWCCQYTPTRSGGECAWFDGLALYTDAKAYVHDGKVEKPLAYEACSFAAQFAPLAPTTCKRGRRGQLGAFRAPTLNACSQLCSSPLLAPDCKAFGYSEHEALCGRTSCELYSECAATNRLSDEDKTFEWYGKKPQAAGALGASSPADPGLAFSAAKWPEQMGAPLGLQVNANRLPGDPHRLGGNPFSENIEYVCDTADGRKADDAMNLGGDWSNSCSQICLPKAFWGPASKRGVIHGKCKENGCTTFVAARKYAGVPYNIYNCTCPTTNASALYDCPPPPGEDGGSGGGDTLVC